MREEVAGFIILRSKGGRNQGIKERERSGLRF